MPYQPNDPLAMVAWSNLQTDYGNFGQPLSMAEAVNIADKQKQQQRAQQIQEALPQILSKIDPNNALGSLIEIQKEYPMIDLETAKGIVDMAVASSQAQAEAEAAKQNSALNDLLMQGEPTSGELTEEQLRGLLSVANEGQRASIKAMLDAKRQGVEDQNTRFTQENQLADDYKAEVKNIADVRSAYQRMQDAYNLAESDPEAGGVADIQMLYAYIKSQDPTSTVREGEFATAEQAPGVTQALLNQYNKLVSGDRLTPAARKNFLRLGKKNYENANKILDKAKNRYTKRAKDYGLDPSNIVFELPEIEDTSLDDVPQELQDRGITPQKLQEYMRMKNAANR